MKRTKYENCAVIDIRYRTRISGGGDVCSFPHGTHRRATHRIIFKNGASREVCGKCAKKYLKKKYSSKVERIEPVEEKKPKARKRPKQNGST